MKKISKTVPSETISIKKASRDILNSLKPFNVSEDRLFDIKLCIEEAVRNAIIHGNKSNQKLPVKIAYWIDGDDLSIEIEDAGGGFDHKTVRDPTKDENLTRNSGRGVYLIKKLMDKIEFSQRGNKIKMVKNLGLKEA